MPSVSAHVSLRILFMIFLCASSLPDLSFTTLSDSTNSTQNSASTQLIFFVELATGYNAMFILDLCFMLA